MKDCRWAACLCWFRRSNNNRAKLIARLASVGNPEACFYTGMRAVFVEDRTALMPRLDMLEHSAVAGHDVAAFVLSLVLHRSNSGAGNDNIQLKIRSLDFAKVFY